MTDIQRNSMRVASFAFGAALPFLLTACGTDTVPPKQAKTPTTESTFTLNQPAP